MMAMTGRPSTYTSELAAAICDRLATGESLRAICSEDAMPCKATIFIWLSRHAEFLDQYARAREAQADFLAEEIIEIADDGSRDYTEKVIDGRTTLVVDHDHIQRSRLRVDARKWAASKMAPKKYGERIQAEHSGAVDVGLTDLMKALDGRTRGLPTGG